MVKLEQIFIPASLLDEKVSLYTKAIAAAILSGHEKPDIISSILGIGRRTVYDCWQEAKTLAEKHKEGWEIELVVVHNLCGSRTLPAHFPHTSRTFDAQHPAYQLEMLQTLNSEVTRAVENELQAVKQSVEKLAFEVLPTNINKEESKTKNKNNISVRENFVPPTIQEITDQFRISKPGLPEELYHYNAHKFYNLYEEKNWVPNGSKEKMKKWKNSVGRWGLNEIPKAELSLWKSKVPAPVQPEKPVDPFESFSPLKSLIPEVDAPEFSLLSPQLQKLAHEANARYYSYSCEIMPTFHYIIKNKLESEEVFEMLKQKHQYNRILEAKFIITHALNNIQNGNSPA